ncbi:heme exporter protein B [Bathymodiolus platifrons methanotrophic gill symbiont]|uniref:heme exporter protein CcmB n=1 Tax=Bathymodiolus platifrons methanotrophic gill symbiont TaxID=113268 RepID=UPI0011C7183A|nr:heme exporter protein CcmB [Bathymodiolus platifrons methanotrophic gill symbiont]TXK99796.1 heme exporter protein CcmB [Methylococcaceae bacterium HT1]TXL18592.1 heme exporter protein CcmB [Methylococcaceae bacterium HT3]TXL23577.1 heme exporter protein CcmB [Methylococcaceae bacterium HT2]GFO74827.1 heme exporter protein B [Bathymodiolus platifrons methanotrophic gill symbiont]
MKFFLAALKRDLLLVFRHRNDIINPLAFFLMVAVLFPLGVSPNPVFLAEVAPGVIWVAALLACLLSVDGIFRTDYDDGSLEQMLVSSESLLLLVLAKVLSHWLISGFCLAIISPLVAMMFFLPEQGYTALILSLLLGTPTLSLMGAIGAGLTVGLRKGGVLISLLVLPLYIPVLIFGAGTVHAGAMGLPIQGYLALLGAILVLSLMLAPFAIAAALKVSVRS